MLLNCDFKIATKAITSHIKPLLPKLVSDDQTASLEADLLERTFV